MSWGLFCGKVGYDHEEGGMGMESTAFRRTLVGFDRREVRAYIEKAQQEAAEAALDYDPTVCSECGAKCSNGVAKYSQEQFGRTLCMKCQRAIGGNQ